MRSADVSPAKMIPRFRTVKSTFDLRSSSTVGRVNRRAFVSTAATAIALASGFSRAADQQVWRVAVIGHTGRGDYGHSMHTLWLDLPDAKIIALADADDKGRALTQRKLGVEQVFADYREMIRQTQPDIVAVCPRHVDEHHDMIVAAVEGGARGIYCEKPFCRTLQEADNILAVCEQRGTKLAIAHRNRYHPALAAMKAAVDDGAIGRLLEIRCRGKEDRRGGAQDLWVLGTHLFNLATFFAGRATACSAVLLLGDRPITRADIVEGAEGLGPIAGDRLHARFETESGVPVFFDSIRDAGTKAAGFGLQLVGTAGMFDLRIDTEPLVHFIPGSPFQPTANSRPWTPVTSAGIGMPEPIHDIKNLVAQHLLPARDLFKSIVGDQQPLCSGYDGRETVEMVHATFASHLQNGQRVALPLVTRTHPFAQ